MSDEMKLCGFQASKGSVTGDYFDGLKAIFCHKYDYQTQKIVNLFNAKGGTTPGTVSTYNYHVDGSNSLFLGWGDCDGHSQCWGSLLCYERSGTGGYIGPGLANGGVYEDWDYCYCPNYPICPIGARDGISTPTFSNAAVMCDDG